MIVVGAAVIVVLVVVVERRIVVKVAAAKDGEGRSNILSTGALGQRHVDIDVAENDVLPRRKGARQRKEGQGAMPLLLFLSMLMWSSWCSNHPIRCRYCFLDPCYVATRSIGTGAAADEGGGKGDDVTDGAGDAGDDFQGLQPD